MFPQYYCTTEKVSSRVFRYLHKSISENRLFCWFSFLLMHKEPWKHLPNLVPAFFCGFRAALSQKKNPLWLKNGDSSLPSLHCSSTSVTCNCKQELCKLPLWVKLLHKRKIQSRQITQREAHQTWKVTQERFVFLTLCESVPRPGLSNRPSGSASICQPSL